MLSFRTKFLEKASITCLFFVSLLGCGGGSDNTPSSGSPVSTNPPPISTPVEAAPMLKFAFSTNNSRNNQGLANANGFYYVGYDVGNGNGLLERYSKAGVLDTTYGRAAIPTRHTAELAYRAADESLYAVSGGGTEKTYVYKVAADGKSVTKTIDFSDYGNSGLLAIDNVNDLFVLATTQSGGDAGSVTFRFIDAKNNQVQRQFTIPSEGTPQGLEVYDNILYFYTNNKISVVDEAGNIIDRWTISTTGESEGLTLVVDGSERYLALGYNTPARVYTLAPIQLGSKAPRDRRYVLKPDQ
jgi:hypothetical protein